MVDVPHDRRVGPGDSTSTCCSSRRRCRRRWSGPPIEEVAFFRDEMANVVWAVERAVPSALGTPIDRYRTSQPASAVTVPVDVTQLGDAEVIYRLATPVPDNWYPYLARRTPAGDDITLERLAGQRPAGRHRPGVVRRRGRGGHPRRPRRPAGVAVRPMDRRPPVLWLGRRVTSGRGEGSSGLRWDATEPRPGSALSRSVRRPRFGHAGGAGGGTGPPSSRTVVMSSPPWSRRNGGYSSVISAA